jgi:hypothetical protein
MDTKKIFSIFLLLLGEALIIIGFLYFGKNLTQNILALNIIVSSIIYLLWFVEKFIPMVDLKDKAHKGIGSIGLKWLFTFLYAAAAIGTMVVFNTVKPVDLYTQIIIHGILFFLLLVGLYFVFYTSQKVGEVFIEETTNCSRIDEMKKATREIKIKADLTKNIPSDINIRVTELLENLRFISPSNDAEAMNLESQYLKEIRDLQDCLFFNPLNYDKSIEILQKCEQTYSERKRIYSK